MAREAHHSPNYGGVRAGQGRPKGSGNRIRLEDLIASIEKQTGVTYTQQLAQNYTAAITREDWKMVNDYDKAFLNKVVADKTEVEVVESEEVVAGKAQAFAEALMALNTMSKGK